VIKTYEHHEKNKLKLLNQYDRVISANVTILSNDSINNYLTLKRKTHDLFVYIDQMDQLIIKSLAEKKTTIWKEFNKKRLIETILLKDSLIYKFKEKLFEFGEVAKQSKLVISENFFELLPTSKNITTQTGKVVEWERFFFLHKPLAVCYMQFKRIKLLVLEIEQMIQQSIIEVIREKNVENPQAGVDTLLKKLRSYEATQVAVGKNEDLQENKVGSKAIATQQLRNDMVVENSAQKEKLFQKIINSLHTEKLFAGVSNQILKGFDLQLERDYKLQIVPSVMVRQGDDGCTVNFPNTGMYQIQFIDIRNQKTDVVFSKNVFVEALPDPYVRLNTPVKGRDVISVHDILSTNRLIASLGFVDQAGKNARINGYRVTKVTKTGDTQSANNQGDFFQPAVQSLIRKLQKGDMLLFDNVTVSLADGTTRSSNSLMYKIIE